jgi:hypothetical protein
MTKDQQRIENNIRVLFRAADPSDDLRTCDIVDTCYPPRQIIKKDAQALEFLSRRRNGNAIIKSVDK